MKKFSRRKMALALACASIFGGKTQAMKEPQSRQNVVAVGRATDKNSNKRFANRAKDHKWQLAVGIGVPVAAASILAFLGVKYWGKKDNDGDPNKKPNINNPNINNPNKNQQTENKSNDEENNPEKDPIKVLNDINQAQVNPKKETIQVQNPINANPISVPIPVVQKVKPKEESIIEKNITKIKRESKGIANETFELFFDKVASIRRNKNKLLDNMVTKVSKFDIQKNKFCKILLSEENAGVLGVIKQVVKSTIESLYDKEVDAYPRLSVYPDSLDLSLGGNKLISISKDGKTLLLRNYYYSIQFDISSLNIGELNVKKIN
jgi:hypothetical protein